MTTLNTSIIKSLVDHTGDDTSIIPDGSVPILDVSGNLTVNGTLYSNHLTLTQDVSASGGPNLYMGPLKIRTAENTANFFLNDEISMRITSGDVKVDKPLTVAGKITANDEIKVVKNIIADGLKLTNPKRAGSLVLYQESDGYLILYDNNDATRHVLWSPSQTITHRTNLTGSIGTFCETNGEIYDGYEQIDNIDCICQVVQSTTLNPKIVGVITSENQFASHGDVLMKVVPGTYKLGDILCPDITGLARVASETELQYMMLHAIPRPKITSLNTGIDGMVATFLI